MDYTKKFDSIIQHTLATDLYDLRSFAWINDRLMGVERCFINPRGMPQDPSERHLLFSVSNKNKYHSVVMATIHDAVCFISLAN